MIKRIFILLLVFSFILHPLLFDNAFSARDFDGTNDNIQNLNGLSGIDVTTRTVFLWGNPDIVGVTHVMFQTASTFSGGNSADSIIPQSGDVWQYAYRWSSSSGFWNFGTVTADTWTSLGCDYNKSSTTNDPNCYENGTLQTETETSTPAGTAKGGVDSIRMGENVGGGGDFDGREAHFSFWDVALSTNEELALFHGVPPLVIRDQNLQFYYSLDGNNSPENEHVQQALGTVTGATKFAGNPPVMLVENYLS